MILVAGHDTVATAAAVVCRLMIIRSFIILVGVVIRVRVDIVLGFKKVLACVLATL